MTGVICPIFLTHLKSKPIKTLLFACSTTAVRTTQSNISNTITRIRSLFATPKILVLPTENTDAAIMWMNSDMILKDDAVERLVEARLAHPEISAFQPKLYRAFCENVGDEVLEETVKSDIIDTTGLCVDRAFRMSDRGAGEIDTGQYDNKLDIFAPSGTIALLPISVIQDTMMDGEMFDKDFFAYREDCDFAWRLRKLGHKALFVPRACAHHYRGMYGKHKQTLWSRLKNRQGQNPFFSAYSTRNQLFVLFKNLTFFDALFYFPWIAFSEGGRILYALVFEPQTRNRLLGGISLLPSMFKKRRQNQYRYCQKCG